MAVSPPLGIPILHPATGKEIRPQVACDRCSLGVMDATNPHLYGECGCGCHDRPYHADHDAHLLVAFVALVLWLV
jgi:hypothetical protein